MPVWHEITKELRASGKLNVVGIVQEQHPDRTQLYADWQGLDFPILWDPFNTLGVEVVLISTFVDAQGVVRKTGLSERKPDQLQALLDKDWVPLVVPPSPRIAWLEPMMAKEKDLVKLGTLGAAKVAMARLLWPESDGTPSREDFDYLVLALEKRLQGKGVMPADHFRAGVGRRLRLDGGHGQPGDWQASIDHWVQALKLNPNQYIWRRRIQQWGPRLDKPYPFYDWVEQAYADLSERGVTFPPLKAALTGSEVAGKARKPPAVGAEQENPDPSGKVLRDESKHVRLEVAVAPHSKVAGGKDRSDRTSARLHVSLDPLDKQHWTPDADPALVWIDRPKDWTSLANLYEFDLPPGEAPTDTLTLDFEITLPKEAKARTLKGYVLYSICNDEGVCLFRRQDFSVEVP